jgi:hypothetical protein
MAFTWPLVIHIFCWGRSLGWAGAFPGWPRRRKGNPIKNERKPNRFHPRGTQATLNSPFIFLLLPLFSFVFRQLLAEKSPAEKKIKPDLDLRGQAVDFPYHLPSSWEIEG